MPLGYLSLPLPLHLPSHLPSTFASHSVLSLSPLPLFLLIINQSYVDGRSIRTCTNDSPSPSTTSTQTKQPTTSSSQGYIYSSPSLLFSLLPPPLLSLLFCFKGFWGRLLEPHWAGGASVLRPPRRPAAVDHPQHSLLPQVRYLFYWVPLSSSSSSFLTLFPLSLSSSVSY